MINSNLVRTIRQMFGSPYIADDQYSAALYNAAYRAGYRSGRDGQTVAQDVENFLDNSAARMSVELERHYRFTITIDDCIHALTDCDGTYDKAKQHLIKIIDADLAE